MNVKADSILGINLNSVVGDLLEGVINVAGSPFGAAVMPSVGVPAWAVSSKIDEELRKVRGRASDAAIYLERLKGQFDPEVYNRTLQRSRTVVWGYQPSWVMSNDLTRFVGAADQLKLSVAFVAEIPNFGQVEGTIDGAGTELERMRSYSKPTQTVVAQRGSSWSSLARKYYRTAFLASALRAHQPVQPTRSRLREGQTVVIPPIWQVTVIPKHYVVKPGDTFEGICRQRMAADRRGCVRTLRRLNPSLRPRKLPALSVIRIESDAPPTTS